MRDSAGVVIVENTGSGVWAGDDVPRVEVVLRIGGPDAVGPDAFGHIAAVDVDPEGRIYALDQQARQVKIFDEAGQFLRAAGGPGSGPGELGPGAVTVLVARDRFAVPDLSLQRLSFFAQDGSPAGDVPLDARQGIAYQWAVLPDGSFIHQSRVVVPAVPSAGEAAPRNAASRNWLIRRTAAGEPGDTLLALPDGDAVHTEGGRPQLRFFGVEPLWAIGQGGEILVARNDALRVSVHDARGALRRIITRPVERLRLAEEDRAVILEGFAETFRSRGMPPQVSQNLLRSAEFTELYPSIARIIGGPDGTVWVQGVRRVNERTGGAPDAIGAPDWHVFDRDGRFLGMLRLPDGFRPARFRGARIYGTWKDDLGVEYVMVLALRGWEPVS